VTLAAVLAPLFTSGSDTRAVKYPATAWNPSGKDRRDDKDAPHLSKYPDYDVNDPKGSFTKVCDLLIEETCAELSPCYEMPEAEVGWVREMLEYNVKGGKMNRGLMVVECGKELLKSQGKTITSDVLNKLAVLGWCTEWLQAWLLMADDVMDDSVTRRGRPCWYTNDNVQTIAINDAFMVEMLVFKILKRHFVDEPYYHQLVDLLLETTFQTECGQLLDTLCMNLDPSDFSVDRWTFIVKYKTAFYSFYMSVALGMIVAGITDQSAYDVAREVLLPMGIYFQAQDDYLDCYGSHEQIGKVGTDIQDKKCGWLFVHAYHELASRAQKRVFDKEYGKCKVDSDGERKIKALYETLGMEQLYHDYEKSSYETIMALKPKVEKNGLVPWSVFEIFLGKIFKRSK